MPGPKPTTRGSAEDITSNLARYDVGGFQRDSKFVLGVNVDYQDHAARVTAVKLGSAADLNGIAVDDLILEVDGAPVGQIGSRTYEVWKRYEFSKNGKVELLLAFADGVTGQFHLYYQTLQLDPIVAASPPAPVPGAPPPPPPFI